MPTDRTPVLIKPIFDGVVASLDAITQFVIGKNERPKTASGKFILPPYAVLSVFPGGSQDGPLSDSQVDVTIRFRVLSVGKSSNESLVVSDLCATRMKPSLITIAGRTVRSISRSTGSSGQDRDDDVATPLFFQTEIYEVDTALG